MCAICCFVYLIKLGSFEEICSSTWHYSFLDAFWKLASSLSLYSDMLYKVLPCFVRFTALTNYLLAVNDHQLDNLVLRVQAAWVICSRGVKSVWGLFNLEMAFVSGRVLSLQFFVFFLGWTFGSNFSKLYNSVTHTFLSLFVLSLRCFMLSFQFLNIFLSSIESGLNFLLFNFDLVEHQFIVRLLRVKLRL